MKSFIKSFLLILLILVSCFLIYKRYINVNNSKENIAVVSPKPKTQYNDRKNVLQNIRNINQKYNNWKNDLDPQEKMNLESEDSLEKLYGYIYRDNKAGVSTLLQSGQIKEEHLNSNGAFALRMSINMGNPEMVKTLIQYGADPNGIDPRMIHDPDMRELVEQKIHERNSPITSSLGFKKPKYN